MTAPLTDQRLDEIQTRAADVGCPDCGVRDAELRQLGDVDVPDLLDEVRRLRAENENLADLDAAATRRAELQAERDRAVQLWHKEHKQLAAVARYLAAIHRHANRHDVLGVDLGCAGCALLAEVEAHLPAPQYRAATAPGGVERPVVNPASDHSHSTGAVSRPDTEGNQP